MQNFLQRYQNNKYSFFNTGTNLKKVTIKWTRFQTSKPTDNEVELFKKLPTQNYAIVCGEISNLVVFDVDTKNGGDPTPFLNRGLHEIRTPSGGYHFYTLYDPVFASTKHQKSKGGMLSAVDIQSNGSLVFAPPSKFSNGDYTIVNDALIGYLPEDLLASILDDLKVEESSQDFTPYIHPLNPEGGRPGDIFNALASWDDVLIPLGWTRVGQARSSGTQFWRRPGKRDGISASTGWNGYNLFFAYTTSTELENMKGYTKFRLLTMLKYGGDFKEAARQLVLENYKRVNNLV